MSTVAGERAARWATNRRVARMVWALTLCSGLAWTTAWFAPRCQAQSTAPQNNSTPPAATDDPPPSLIKHPKPAPAPPPQATPPPAPQSGSTPAPSEQPPAARSGGTQTPTGQSDASAAPPSAQNPAPGQAATQSTTAPSVSPTSAGDTSATPAQPSDSGQASTGDQSSSPSPAYAVPVSDSLASALEINTRTSTVPLESHANLVPVRVVVHDSSGHAVENLQKDDFQVKQDGKLQFITHFSLETLGSAAKQVAPGEAIALPPDPNSYSLTDSAAGDAAKSGAAPTGSLAMPSRFVALLFDDAHLNTGDLTRSKLAAMHFIDSSLKPNQRLAVFTVSGQNQVDFTDDHAKIRDAITHMIATPMGAYDPATQHDCLQITYYQADLIQNKNDPQALAAADADALACVIATTGSDRGAQQLANSMVMSTVARSE